MQIVKLIVVLIIFITLSAFYKKLKKNEDTTTNGYYHAMIEKYLLNKDDLGMNQKPILWVYLQNDTPITPEVNSRFWLNFGSRLTTNFNQPYQKLTIQSIINKCKDDFNICLIDNNAFKILLPEWNVNLNNMAQPIKSHMHLIALASLLHNYGGLLVPSSFICFKSFKDIYEQMAIADKMLVGNFQNLTANEKLSTNLIPYPILMGCEAGNPVMKAFVDHLVILNSTDFTAEMDFLGKANLWLQNSIINHKTIPLCGKLIGTQKRNGSIVHVEELTQSSFIDLDDNAYGLYIPWDQLINRINLQWFVRLSPEQVVKSNTMIGKYILAHH